MAEMVLWEIPQSRADAIVAVLQAARDYVDHPTLRERDKSLIALATAIHDLDRPMSGSLDSGEPK